MKPIKVITFGEFLEIAETNTGLIYPDEDDSIRDKHEIGIISGRSWCPVEFSDKVMEMKKKDVWYIDCSTGCSCCAYENFNQGFYTNEEEVNEVVAKWRKGEGNPLASQYAKYGIYYIIKEEAEILPDGRMIVDNKVYSANYFGESV